MKKRKTALLTVSTISLFLLLIVAGAKIFTGRLGEINEIENNLTAEVIPVDNNAFDYPYIDFKNLKTSTENEAKRYIPLFTDSDFIYYGKEDFVPDENMLTHQQAANIFGEAVKYLYGYTGHTNNPVIVAYDKEFNSKKYPNMYCIYYTDTERQVTLFSRIDPLTGRITYINNHFPINFDANSQLGAPEHPNLPATDEIYGKITETILQNLELMGFDESIETLKINNITLQTSYDNCDFYEIITATSESRWRTFTYGTEDNEYFEMMRADLLID